MSRGQQTMIFAITLLMLGFLTVKPALCGAGGVNPCNGQCPGELQCCGQSSSKAAVTVRTDEEVYRNSPLQYYVSWLAVFLIVGILSLLVCWIWYTFNGWSLDPIRDLVPCCLRPRPSEHDSASSAYPPPRYSRCGSFHQPPPPYAEVTSKPDLYPLVITCGEGDGKSGGNYLMVHYFRNYVIQEPGSLSATSTAESLNSSFLCNATNEANSVEPPPYSCASNYAEGGGGVLRSLSSLTPQSPSPPAPTPAAAPAPAHAPASAPRTRPRTISDSDRPRLSTYHHNLFLSPVQPLELVPFELPRVDGSPTTSPLPSTDGGPLEPEVYALQQYFRNEVARRARLERACLSPPRPISPTDSVNWPIEERRLRRKMRKSSLYMPLTTAPPPRPARAQPARATSRSAPATPSGTLPTFSLRHSRHSSRHSSRNSRLDEESNPLLTEMEAHVDHKF